MPYQHTRNPYDLGDDNYGEYCGKLKDFLAEPNSLPRRPTHMVAEQIARADVFIVALDEFHTAETLSQNATKVVEAAVNGVKSKLLWFKYILPTVIIGPDTLVEEFGLAGDLPKEYAKIKNKGDEVWAIWEIRKVEPMFAPILADGDLLQGLLTSYDNAISAQNTAQNVYSSKSFTKNEAREAHHFVSQEIFNVYRAFYPDAQDEYWIKTPWGKASGGGGEEEPQPGVTKWNDTPVAKIIKASYPLNGLLAGCETYDGTVRFDLCIAFAKKNEPVPTMPVVVYATDVEQPVFLGLNFPLQKGNVYYVWIRARKDGEVSDWSEPAGCEWTQEGEEPEPVVPK